MALDPRSLRSLVSLLDDENPSSLEIVRRKILDVGTAALPYIAEARAAVEGPLGARLDAVAQELRFTELRAGFTALSAQRIPDLEAGSWLISRFGHPEADPAIYKAWLDRVAASAGDSIPEDASTGEAAVALAAHLFRSMGFAGNEENYDDPNNGFLTRVIDTRRGIPVTLSTVYLLLAKRLRIAAYGVGAPGHFLLGYRDGGEARFLDAFRQGRRMETSEARRMIVRNGYAFRPEHLRPCGPRVILARTMRNLAAVYQRAGAAEQAERMASLIEIVVTGTDSAEPS